MARRATIASLNAQLTLGAGRFFSGMRRVKQSVRGFTSQAKKGESRARGLQRQLNQTQQMNAFSRSTMVMTRRLVGMAAAALGVTTALSKMRGAVAESDRIIKEARMAGVLAGEYQNVEFAMDRVGVGAERLGTNVQRMNRRLARGIDEGSALNQALGRLGLTASGLFGMGLQDRFIALAEGLDSVGHQSLAATRALDELFGREGMQMRLLFGLGPEEMERLFETSRGLGGALQSLSGNEIEQLVDQTAQVREQFSRIWQTIAISISPELTRMAEGMSEFGLRAGTARSELSGIGAAMRVFGGLIRGPIRLVEILTRSLRLMFNGILSGVIQSTNAILGLVEKIPLIGGRFDQARDELTAFADLTKDAMRDDVSGLLSARSAAARDLAHVFGGLNDELQKNPAISSDVRDRMAALSAEIESLREETEGAASAQSSFNDFISDVVDVAREGRQLFERMRTPVEQYAAEMERINFLHDAGAISAETFSRAMDDLNERFEDPAVTAMRESSERRFEELEGLAESIQRELRTPKQVLEDELSQLNEIMAAGLLPDDVFQKAVDRAWEKFRISSDDHFGGIVDDFREFTEDYDRVARSMVNRQRAWVGSLSDIVLNGPLPSIVEHMGDALTGPQSGAQHMAGQSVGPDGPIGHTSQRPVFGGGGAGVAVQHVSDRETHGLLNRLINQSAGSMMPVLG